MNSTTQVAAHSQMRLDLGIEVEKSINGVEMGVLENGIPYLTQRGIARITGASRLTIQKLTQEWEDHYDDEVLSKDRISFIKQYLFQQGYDERSLYIEIKKGGTVHFAYPDVVCMAILEYYAFEARTPTEEAIANYRKFAALGLRRFIYEALEYAPADKWKYHNDRVSILQDAAPIGYFTVFQEVVGLVVDLINADLTVNEKTIPDISVGQHWAKHWKASKLNEKHGDRVGFSHNYPSYYPQADSNPQPANAYPDAALPEFRKWFRETYLLSKFPSYILKKANILAGGKPEAQQIAGLFAQKTIGNG